MVLCRGARLGFLFQRSSVQTRLLSPWYLPESPPFPRCTSAESCMGGAWECWWQDFVQPLSCQAGPVQVQAFTNVSCTCECVSSVIVTQCFWQKGGEARPGLQGLSAAEHSQGCSSAPRRAQPHTAACRQALLLSSASGAILAAQGAWCLSLTAATRMITAA